MADLELMSIGMVLDFIQEFIDQNKPKKKTARKANQTDFDAF